MSTLVLKKLGTAGVQVIANGEEIKFVERIEIVVDYVTVYYYPKFRSGKLGNQDTLHFLLRDVTFE